LGKKTHIKAVVVVKQELELRGKVACSPCNNTERNGCRGTDKARRGGDRNETRDCTRAKSDNGPLLLQTVIPEHPGEPSDARSEVGDDARLGGTEVGRECRAAVEPEPAKPEEDCPKDDVGGVVGLVGEALGAIPGPLSEVDGDGKGGGSGRDMDGSSSGEIEASHDEAPAGGVPGPACDGVIDEGGPDKDKECNGTHAATLCETTEGEHGSDGSEHELVDAKNKGGDADAAHGGLVEDTFEGKVLEVADEGVGAVGKGEGVAPEEPLEGDDGQGHHAEVDHAEGILATEEARVEKADTRNHQPDEGGRAQRPGDVAKVVDDSLTARLIVPLDVVGCAK
jgi:hypothetical protein